jgi:hypothetical protein
MTAKRALKGIRAPDEPGAESRAWPVIQSAYARRAPTVPNTSRRRIAWVMPAAVLAALALAFSPAGASVRRWINDALGVPHAARMLGSLPSAGSLLVAGQQGTWTVAADGATRRLGPWRQAAWSPHGLFVAGAGANELAAIDPRGALQWKLARPLVSDPVWYPPSGFRIAYRSGRTLRVVAGDGSGDHMLAGAVASLAPAWRPDHPYELSYIDASGRLVTRDGDTARTIWTAKGPAHPTALGWSSDGRRLLVVSSTSARVYDPRGRLVTTISAPTETPILNGSISPDGHELALVRGGSSDEVVLANLANVKNVASPQPQLQRVLSEDGLRQVDWSPDGRWLLVSWPRADQWVFVRVVGKPRIAAVSRIAQQFAVGRAAHGFPHTEGWCCTAAGAAG